jgi:hypothetical protein
MPLKSGKSAKTVSSNVSELMGAYKAKGKIGASIPKSKKAAQKQSVAIALKKAGKSNKYAKGGSVMYVKRRDADQLTKIC